MNATSLLTSQHRKVEALFKKLENGRSDHAPLLVQVGPDQDGIQVPDATDSKQV